MAAGRQPGATALAVAAGILVLSLVPSPAGDPVAGIGPADKAAHAFGYAVLGMLTVRAVALDPRLATRWPRPTLGLAATLGTMSLAVVVVLSVAAFGGGIELLQHAVPGRQFEVADALANTVGATIGVGWWTGRHRSNDPGPGIGRMRSDAGR